jgi:hypothetical protein
MIPVARFAPRFGVSCQLIPKFFTMACHSLDITRRIWRLWSNDMYGVFRKWIIQPSEDVFEKRKEVVNLRRFSRVTSTSGGRMVIHLQRKANNWLNLGR